MINEIKKAFKPYEGSSYEFIHAKHRFDIALENIDDRKDFIVLSNEIDTMTKHIVEKRDIKIIEKCQAKLIEVMNQAIERYGVDMTTKDV